MKKTRMAAVASFALALVTIAFTAIMAGRAEATPPTPTECPTWTLQSIVTEWGPAAEGSQVVNANKVVLTKPTGGGTEFAAKNLNMEFDTPKTLRVFYSLDAEADYAAGAVRLFYYEANNPDTLTEATAGFDAAESKVGMLEISNVTKLGTVGLVYDASNSAAGKVTFTNLKIGNTKLAFKNVCPEATPSATATPTPTVTATPSASVSPSASTTSAAPAPSVSKSLVAGGGPSLPVTGTPTYLVAGAGLLLVVAGVIGLVVARKRRVETELP